MLLMHLQEGKALLKIVSEQIGSKSFSKSTLE